MCYFQVAITIQYLTFENVCVSDDPQSITVPKAMVVVSTKASPDSDHIGDGPCPEKTTWAKIDS